MDHKIKLKYRKNEHDIKIDEFFLILNMSYQIGVFVSRSSLGVIKIKKIWTLTALQLLNFILLFMNAKYMFIESLHLLCPILVWVGIMGGGAYVNVLHNILELKTLRKTEKESAISLCLMFNDTGILLASVASLLFDNYFFNI
jgi:battenin